MTQPFRLASGGAIDRARLLHFRYDDTALTGYAGDTLAAALLANGVHLCARSFKYHRPRGIVSAGAEEPNALVQLDVGARTEPNARATQVELHDGLVARSQNCWPSVRFAAGAFTGLLAPLLPAGFYYKTFMWPGTPRAWLFYERWIRRAAGMGRGATTADPDRYAHRHAHCDVLVIGAGPAGLAAARAAAASGARVIVCDENATAGGNLRGTSGTIDGQPADAWTSSVLCTLADQPHVTVLPRTTAFGYYDHNLVGLCERIVRDAFDAPRERLWHVRARHVILATGAHERPVAYAGNDLPGTLLAGSARAYIERYAVQPGRRAVVFTNNDGAYDAALALQAAGGEIAAIVDARAAPPDPSARVRRARDAALPIVAGAVITTAHGRLRVQGVDLAPRRGGRAQRMDCDRECVSGGRNTAVLLHS